MKKKGNFLVSLFKGAVQAIPGGNAVTTIVPAIKEYFERKNNPTDDPKKYDLKAIISEIAGIGFIVYAFASKMITIEQVLHFLGFAVK